MGLQRSQQRQGKGPRAISVSARAGLSSLGPGLRIKTGKQGSCHAAATGRWTEVTALDSRLWVWRRGFLVYLRRQ